VKTVRQDLYNRPMNHRFCSLESKLLKSFEYNNNEIFMGAKNLKFFEQERSRKYFWQEH
jgi:hypothetical protein